MDEFAAMRERRAHLAQIEELQEEAARHREDHFKLRGSCQRLEQLNAQLEAENARLADRVEELKSDVAAIDADNTELQAVNRALQQVLDEKEVQVAAQQQYEVEFDNRVTAMLDERDRELAEVNREREMLILKVKELQEELGLVRRAGAQESTQELTMLLKAKQLEIEDLEDRTEALEEEVGRLRQRLGAAADQDAGADGTGVVPGVTPMTEGQVEQRLSAFKADAIQKENHIIDLERKLEEFAKGLGAEGILRQNYELEKQVQTLKREVADAKRDLSEYLSEAASIVYENDLLRSIANVQPDQLSLQEFKLKEKVTSAKAVALQRQLEREVYELEEERVKLKRRVRQMSELAAEKVSLLHDLQPEQMLQLEEIAASMRRGRLELPMTDETRQLRKEKEELQKKLNEKDRQVADHVDRKVDELLKQTASSKEKALLEKENAQLRQMAEDLQKNMMARVEQATMAAAQSAVQAAGGQVPAGFMEHLHQMQSQMQAQMQHVQQVQGLQAGASAVAQLPQLPKAPGPSGVSPAPLTPGAAALSGPMAALMGPWQQGALGQQPGQPTPGMLAAGPVLMPRIPGMSPTAWSTAMSSAVQLPRRLADGSPETLCFLYCQIIECVEELAREKEVRVGLAQEVEVYSKKFDVLLAEQEVLYKDYFKQRRNWEDDRKQMEERLRKEREIAGSLEKKLETEMAEKLRLKQVLNNSGDVGGSQNLKGQLLECLQRISALEQNESVLARKCDRAEKDHDLVKKAFDQLEKDFCERERYLKERLSKAVLWKQRAANALRVAQQKHQQMVSRIEFERVQLELQVSKRREVDLIRRQSELSVANAQKEDRLRDMSDLQERCANLDNLIRESEQEFTVMRGRLQRHEPSFAVECALFTRLVANLQRVLGQVGNWDTAARVLVASEKGPDGQDQLALWAGVAKTEENWLPSVEVSFDEKLRKLDTNNDGFIALGEVRRLLESFGVPFSDTDMQTFALAFHVTLPMLAAPPQTPAGSTMAAPRVDMVSLAKASVSVLGIVGRLRLFGLRSLEPEDMFWTSLQDMMLRRQLDAQTMLRTGFQIFRATDGFIAAHDILHVLAKYELGVDRLPARALRRVLSWLSADERILDEVVAADSVPGIGDPREADVRGRLFGVKLIYHEFAERFEKSAARALELLRPSEERAPAGSTQATAGALTASTGAGTQSLGLPSYLAEAREAAANRRCVILEQEVRMKSRSVRELQRQVNELEELSQRLEQEVHSERGQNVELKARLDSMLPRDEVEPKLRRLDELQFEVQQSRTALQHEKDMARVCASQAENYEQLIKRRQQETRHLQNTVKMLQASDEMSNTVGKLQYRLLLSQWEKGNMERQLQASAQELRQTRKALMDIESEVEGKEQVWKTQQQELLSKLEVTTELTEKYKEQATACLPIDKARQLSSKMEQVATKKSQLEEKLQQVKRQLHLNQSKMEEYRLQASQAKELLQEVNATTSVDDAAAPRKRLLDMAAKVSEAKLLEMRHKRDLELVKEEHTHLSQARDTDSKEIERLQKEVAHFETRLAQEDERWRLKLMEMQQLLVSSTNSQGGAAAPGRLDLKKASQGTIESLEQLSEKMLQKDAKIDELQVQLEKKGKEMDATLEQERLRVRQLELEISLTSEGDIGKLRQTLRAQHEAEMAQLTEAARESVATLQALLDQAEKQIKLHQQERDSVMDERRKAAAKHEEQLREAQQEISNLRRQVIQGHMQLGDGETAARLTPLSTMHLDTMTLDGSQFTETPHGGGGADLAVQAHLEQRRQEVLMLQERLAAKEQEFQRAAQEHAEEFRRREQGLLQELQHREHNLIGDLQARDQERQRQFRSKEENFRRLLHQHAAEAERFKAAHAASTTAEARAMNEAQAKAAEAALAQLQQQQQQWLASEMQQQQQQQEQRLASSSLQSEIERLQLENDRLHTELMAERDRGSQSAVRRQQQTFRKQLAGKQEQLETMKKTIEALKDEVVRLTQAQEKDKDDHLLAQRNEAEMRRRVQGQEDRMRQLKEQTLRLKQQLEDQRMMNAVEAERGSKQVKRQEALLDEAGEKLAECSSDARRAEELHRREERRAREAEEQLMLERLLLTNEAHVTKEDARLAMQASDRRVAKLHELIDSLEAEKRDLLVQVQSQGDLKRQVEEQRARRELVEVQIAEMAKDLEVAKGRAAAASVRADSDPLGANVGLGMMPLQEQMATHAEAVERLKSENDDLRLQLLQAGAEAERPSGATTTATVSASPQAAAMEERHQDLARRLEALTQENLRLQQMQVPTPAADDRLREYATRAEEQAQENLRLRQQLADQAADLQGRLHSLVAENAQLRQESRHLGQASPERQQLQSQVATLLRENEDLRRRSSRSPPPQAETTSARVQVIELRTQLDELRQENLRLQQQLTKARSQSPGGAVTDAASLQLQPEQSRSPPRTPPPDSNPMLRQQQRQVASLTTALKKSEEECHRLKQEVLALTRQQSHATLRHDGEQRSEARSEPLHVLLSQGDGAPPLVKELKLEVRGTQNIRDRLFQSEAALEDCRKKLEVDAKAELAKEQKKAGALLEQLEEKERIISDLRFDLKRARSAASDPDGQHWAAREEEIMALSTRAMRLEEDLAVRRKTEADLEDKLLEQEHENMELRFEREHARSRMARLENRLLELELIREAPTTAQDPYSAYTSGAAGIASAKTRKERNLEQVVEGLERVVTQLKQENQRLKSETDGRREDRRYRLEAERLKKRLEAMQEEIDARDKQLQGRQMQRGAKQVGQARQARGSMGGNVQRELEQKDRQIAALEERMHQMAYGQSPLTGESSEQVSHEVSLLQTELRQLRAVHEADVAALDEAQRALQDAEHLEQKYREVAQENKRLRSDLVALEDDGFWRDLEDMHRRNEEGGRLLREAKASISRMVSSFPGTEPPSDLLTRIDEFTVAASSAA